MKIHIPIQYFRSHQVTKEDVLSHVIREEWEPLPKLHCPRCGVRAVWHDCGSGDYYVEEQYLCAMCGSGWYMPGGVCQAGNSSDLQRLGKIREASTATLESR